MRRGWATVGVVAVIAVGAGYAYQHPAFVSQFTGGPVPAHAQGAGAPPAPAAQPGTGQNTPSPRRGRRGGGGATAVVTEVAVKGSLPIIQRSIGWIEPVAVVSVKPRIDGELASQLVTNGQFVNQGDLLFTLDDRPIRATIAKDQANIAKDQAMAVSAEADLKRAQALATTSAGTRQALDQATAAAKSAQANIAADQATLLSDQLTLSYTQIKAPISGRLGAIQITPGNLVKGNDASTTLVTITQIKPIRVRFALPDRDVGALRAALAAKPPPLVDIYQHGAMKPQASGTLDFVDSSVDTASGTIQAKATIPNADMALWPGEYVDVTVPLGEVKDATIIPTVAIQPGQKGSFVYVIKPDKTVEMRQVTVALSQGEKSAVTAGLKPGEHVVVDGQLNLPEGAHVVEHVRQSEAENHSDGSVEKRS